MSAVDQPSFEREARKPYLRERILDALKNVWPIDRKVDKIGIQRAVDLVEKSKVREHLKPGGRYLDIGTGLGHIVERVVQVEDEMDVKFLACDPIWTPQDRVKERLEEGRKVLFLKAEGWRLPVKDRSVDGASLFFVLHHVGPDQEEHVFEEIDRVVAEDGLLFLVEDTPGNEEEAARNEIWDRRLNFEPAEEPHFYRSSEEWRKFLDGHGWEIIDGAFFEDESSKEEEGLIRHTSFIARRKQKDAT